MSDEEKQEETSEEPQAEEPQAEEPQAEEPQAEVAADDEETPAPGSEAEEAADDGEAEGPEDAVDAPVDEPEAPTEEREPSQKDKKGKKDKDVIPGADLEPIAVEQAEERPLSAEERARREAEEEERAQREAELVGEGAEEPSTASRVPAKLESGRRFLATGKRKCSIARVILLPGDGKFEINSRSLEEFFPRPLHRTMALQPLATTGYEGNVDVRVRVHGGGVSGQASAVRHGIARALVDIDPALRPELKRRGMLTRDARVKERRKAGLKKARKKPQFSKR